MKTMEQNESNTRRRKQGFSLLEVIVGLAMLAMVLVSVMGVRVLAQSTQSSLRGELASTALLRQSVMDYESRTDYQDIPPSTNGYTDTGLIYRIDFFSASPNSPNTDLGFTRGQYEVSITGISADTTNGAAAVDSSQLYASLIKPLSVTETNPLYIWYVRPQVTESDFYSSINSPTYQLILQSSSGAAGLVAVQGQGYQTNSTNYYPMGQTVNIQAEVMPGHNFVGWQGVNISNSASPFTSVILEDDQKITAQFQ